MSVRTTRTLPVPPESNRRFDSDSGSPRDPLFGRPGDQSLDDLRDQEQHDGAAKVFAHGFHVSSLKFYRGNSHKDNPKQIYDRGRNGLLLRRQFDSRTGVQSPYDDF